MPAKRSYTSSGVLPSPSSSVTPPGMRTSLPTGMGTPTSMRSITPPGMRISMPLGMGYPISMRSTPPSKRPSLLGQSSSLGQGLQSTGLGISLTALIKSALPPQEILPLPLVPTNSSGVSHPMGSGAGSAPGPAVAPAAAPLHNQSNTVSGDMRRLVLNKPNTAWLMGSLPAIHLNSRSSVQRKTALRKSATVGDVSVGGWPDSHAVQGGTNTNWAVAGMKSAPGNVHFTIHKPVSKAQCPALPCMH